MTWWCTDASSWCFLLSKRCRIFVPSSATPHIQPAFPWTRGRWCDVFLVLVSLEWSMCRRKAEGRYQQRRGGCFRHVRPLPIALMQKWPKLTQKEIKQFQKAKIRNLSLHMHLHGSYFGICLELANQDQTFGAQGFPKIIE